MVPMQLAPRKRYRGHQLGTCVQYTRIHLSVTQDSSLNTSNLRLLLLVLLVLHPLHNPPARLLGILVRRLLVLHNLLHLAEVVGHIHALVDSGALLNRLQPGLDFWEAAGLDAGPFAPVDCTQRLVLALLIQRGTFEWKQHKGRFRLTPRENANITQSVLVADQVRRLAGGDVVDFALRREAVVQHLVQALGLGLVAVDGVGDLLGGVCANSQLQCPNHIHETSGIIAVLTPSEVVGLPLHWSNAALLYFKKDWVSLVMFWLRVGAKSRILDNTYHPDQPLDRFPVLVAVVRERDLVVLVVLLAKVQLHAGAFEDTLRLAGCVVDERWDTSVRCREIIVSS